VCSEIHSFRSIPYPKPHLTILRVTNRRHIYNLVTFPAGLRLCLDTTRSFLRLQPSSDWSTVDQNLSCDTTRHTHFCRYLLQRPTSRAWHRSAWVLYPYGLIAPSCSTRLHPIIHRQREKAGSKRNTIKSCPIQNLPR
jgi:hypothetical protein